MKFLMYLRKGAGQALMYALLSFFLFLGACVGLRQAWLVFFVFIPLLYGLQNAASLRQSYLTAFFFGCAFHALVFFWIVNVSWLLFGLAVLVQAFFTGLFGAGLYFLKQKGRGIKFCLSIAALWTLTEFVRSSGFWGLPAGLVGYMLAPYPALAQPAAWTGVWGLSFWVLLVNASLTEILVSPGIEPFPSFDAGLMESRTNSNSAKSHLKQDRRFPRLVAWIVARQNRQTAGCHTSSFRQKAILIFIVGFLIFVPYLFGKFIIKGIPPLSSLRVTIIQPNILKEQKKSFEFWPQNFRIYRTMTETALAAGSSDLVVWPETAVPFFLFHPQRADILRQIRDVVQTYRRPLLLGTQDFRQDTSGPHAFNVAVLFSGQGQNIGQYAKIKLVPILEYMPVRCLIPWVRRLGGVGVYEPGREHKIFRVGEAAFSTVICFEGLFPNLIRKFVRNGAAIVINMTNDEPSLGRMGFYYRQNAQMLQIRAIENRRSFIRVANNGVSMVIDPWGRVIREAPAFSRATFTSEVPLSGEKTPFFLFGNWLIWACLIGLAVRSRFL